MKKIFYLLLFIPLAANAQDVQTDTKTPPQKNEIGLTGARALDLMDFTIFGRPFFTLVFGNISYYRNFNRMQPGVGLDIEARAIKQTNDIKLSHYTPHLLLNRTIELRDFCLYAGVMAGYVIAGKSVYADATVKQETVGSGIVGGIQAGVLFKLNEFVAINTEIAGRAREMDYTGTTTLYGNLGPGMRREIISEYGRSHFYLPLKLGIRVRF